MHPLKTVFEQWTRLIKTTVIFHFTCIRLGKICKSGNLVHNKDKKQPGFHVLSVGIKLP